MNMIEMKPDDLIGRALDWAVAEYVTGMLMTGSTHAARLGEYSPSTNWAHGGPLLERNPWALPYRATNRYHLGAFEACTPGGFPHNGPTPLVAGMRTILSALAVSGVLTVPAELVLP